MNLSIQQKNMEIKKIYDSNEVFNWNLYEKNRVEENEKFLGIDKYSSQEESNQRINFLKNQMQKNNFIELYSIEILLLLKMGYNKITINKNGEFVIAKSTLQNFINSFSYDIESVNIINEIKKEYTLNKNIKLDAKKLFFIMKNSKKIGFDNLTDYAQLFKVVSETKDIDIVDLKENKLTQDIIILEDNIFNQEQVAQKEESKKKDEITNDKIQRLALENINKKIISKEETKDGIIYEFENGLIMLKKSAWDMDVIFNPNSKEEINKRKRLEEHKLKNELTQTQKKNNNQSDNNQSDKNENKINNKEEAEKSFGKSTSIEMLVQNDKNKVSSDSQEDSSMQYKRADFFKKNSSEMFGVLNTIDEFYNVLKNLKTEQMDHILKEFFYSNSSIVTIEDNKKNIQKIKLFFLCDDRLYLSSDYLLFILLSFIKNHEEFILNNLVMNNNNSIIKTKIVKKILKVFFTRVSELLKYDAINNMENEFAETNKTNFTSIKINFKDSKAFAKMQIIKVSQDFEKYIDNSIISKEKIEEYEILRKSIKGSTSFFLTYLLKK